MILFFKKKIPMLTMWQAPLGMGNREMSQAWISKEGRKWDFSRCSEQHLDVNPLRLGEKGPTRRRLLHFFFFFFFCDTRSFLLAARRMFWRVRSSAAACRIYSLTRDGTWAPAGLRVLAPAPPGKPLDSYFCYTP